MAGPPLEPGEILAALRELATGVAEPLWLTGGVAVDFLAGRWTRPHGDIDLCALAGRRAELAAELGRIGYRTEDAGWLTHWRQAGTGRVIEVVFLERGAGGEAALRIAEGDPVGRPGDYPLPAGYLDEGRAAELGGVRFRVCSAEGEWLARAGADVVGDRPRDPKLDHDMRVLEGVLGPEVVARLRAGR